jgi:hypothetical protein
MQRHLQQLLLGNYFFFFDEERHLQVGKSQVDKSQVGG